MSTAAFSRPQGAEPENPRGPSGASNSGGAQAQAQAQVPGQDPGLVHPQLVSRPLYYVHAPPPPFMHYQWPMPFYNPFNPFSGMGYGMMMPPFPPAAYMDPPAYFVPHAPVQPLDYRRMAQPYSAPYQNPNATRRPRPPQPPGPARETVNTEVQTEPRGGEFHEESPRRSSSDSGRETASTSPTSSTSSQKKSNEDVESYNEPNKGLQMKISCTRGSVEPCLPTPSPEERQSIPKISEDNSLVNLQSLKNRNVLMMRQENVTPVNSPRKDMSKKERRISVPDILLSWGNGTPQEDKTADDDKNEKLPPYDDEIENFQSSTVLNEEQLEPETVDAEKDENEKVVESKSRYEPFERSLSISIKLCNTGNDTVNELTLEEPSGSVQTPNGKFRRKLNESVWSVESLPVYVPTKEWLAQNTTAGPEVILELQEEAENGENEKPENPKNRLNSSTDSVQLSDSFIDFSTPASKMDIKQTVPSEPKNYKMQKCLNPLDSPIIKMKMSEICAKEIEIIETSEPAQNPKRRSFTAEEKLDQSEDSNKDKTITLDSEKASEESSAQKNALEVGAGLLLVPPLDHVAMELSPSKGNLVDCGVQFPEFQTSRGNASINRKPNANASDVYNCSARSEGANWQKKRHNQGRNKGPYRPYNQQEVYFDYNKPGKQRGGKGRH
ncbi:transcription factor TFIIIB component B'' homolog [Boleophthalmus pectinirostris]|uniref:transcription factor TFIIIB component B'' homolog n=1 Tax=Boleophthalmus pectinirostris TaxID=150288 RepID=UPI002430AF96|nr:transcription factor TFIIIB component B'' homolog [Boleophthalmus pectinirostris]